MQTKQNEVEIVSSNEAKVLWPNLIASFLEKFVNWRLSSSERECEARTEIDHQPNNTPRRITCEFYLVLSSSIRFDKFQK